MKRFQINLCLLLLLLLTSPVRAAIDFIYGVARQFVIEANFVSLTDGSVQTSLTPASMTIRIYKNNNPVQSITPAACTHSTGTLTSSSTPADGDTITITGTLHGAPGVGPLITEVYRFKNTLAQANDVKIESTNALTLDSLKCTVNDSGCTEGTNYGTGTIPSLLVEATTNTDTTQVFSARIPGTIPNYFTTAKSGTNLSWGGSLLSGGNDNCLEHLANGKYAVAFGDGVFDTFGDINFDFAYSGVAANWQNGKVVAWSANETSVQGLGITAIEFLNLALANADNASGWANRLNYLDASVNGLLNRPFTDFQNADTIGSFLQPVYSGTAEGGTATSITFPIATASPENNDPRLMHKRIQIIKGPGAGQTAIITGYTASTRVATITCEGAPSGQWLTTPTSESVFIVTVRNR